MKPIKIPYLYNINRDYKYLTLEDINKGMILCRKLGFEAISIIVGKEEYQQILSFAFSGSKQDGVRAVSENFIKIIKSRKKNELTFYCDKIYFKGS